MTEAQEKTLEGLKYAIQMEIDGKAHYIKASQGSGNELGKKLLQSLSEAEDYHRQKFEQIYSSIQTKNSWPVVDFQSDGGSKIRTIFSRATEEMDKNPKSNQSELDAVQIGLELEAKSLDYYRSQSAKATESSEREFYDTVAAEEREHQLVLTDYYEFLKDPAGWFVKNEHPSLDGG